MYILVNSFKYIKQLKKKTDFLWLGMVPQLKIIPQRSSWKVNPTTFDIEHNE